MAAQPQFTFDEAELATVERLAQQRGFTNITDYVRELVNADALLLTEDDSDEYILESVKQAWADAKAERVLTWEQIKEALKHDE